MTNFTQIAIAQTIGEYVPTILDNEKSKAEFLITGLYDNKNTIEFKYDPNLSGRGVTKLNTGVYSVTVSALRKLQNEYTWAVDF